MMVGGELDATLLYLTNPNLVDRSRIDLSKDDRFRPLFDQGTGSNSGLGPPRTGIRHISDDHLIQIIQQCSGDAPRASADIEQASFYRQTRKFTHFF